MTIEYIKRRILTEKKGYLKPNKYVFEVENFLTKTQIKACLLELFNLDPNSIISINTHKPPQKQKQRMSISGKKVVSKRAIITLKKGQTIPFANAVK